MRTNIEPHARYFKLYGLSITSSTKLVHQELAGFPRGGLFPFPLM